MRRLRNVCRTFLVLNLVGLGLAVFTASQLKATVAMVRALQKGPLADVCLLLYVVVAAVTMVVGVLALALG